ncbi:MAG: LysR family transcriptional regulator [Defluviitaleaceae bacterium]|nr:LysR family transcriptional regulator [Defluviitaleaceae bacterium]
MTMQKLRYIVEVAKNKSINKAAQSLFISQPYLSIVIKEIEDEIGVSIFEKSRKGIKITSDGAEFLNLAESLLLQIDNMKSRYSPANMSEPKRFQASSQHYTFVVDAFIRFMMECGSDSYKFRISETRTYTVIEDVAEGRSALGFIYLTVSNEKSIQQMLRKKSIEFHSLVSVEPHVFLCKDHALAGRSSIAIEELEPYPSLVYCQEGAGEIYEELAEEIVAIKSPNKVIYVEDRGTLNSIITSTSAYNIGSGYIIPGVMPEEMIAIPLQGVEDVMKIGWICLSGGSHSSDVLRFVELVKESLMMHKST